MSPNLRRWLWKRNKLNADEAALAAELREALKRQQFVLHYQPVLEVRSQFFPVEGDVTDAG